MDSSKSEPPSNFARVFASLGVVLAFFIGKALPLPGLQWSDLPGDGGLFDRILEYSNFSVGTLGANPITSAFISVEIAAFLVPPWRKLRNGSERGRKKLVRAALITTFVIVVAQAFAISQSMQEVLPVSTGSVLGAYVIWTAALLGIAHWAQRVGALGGIQNLILADIAFSLVNSLAGGGETGVGPELMFQLGVIFLALPVLTGAQWSGGASTRRGTSLFPWFVAGIIPLNFAISALGWPSLVDTFIDEQNPTRETTALLLEHPWWTILVLAAALFLFAPAFYRLRTLRMLDRNLGLGSAPVVREKERFSRSQNLSLIYLLLIWGAALLVWREGVSIDLGTPFILAALCIDGMSNLRFRAKHADAVSIYQSHRAYRAVRIAAALRANGLDVHLAGLRHRSLLHFFGPYIPVGVLVPASDAEKAKNVLRGLIRDGLVVIEGNPTGTDEDARSDSSKPVPKELKLASTPLLASLWIFIGLSAMAGAVSLLPPEPVWEPFPAGTIALFEVDDTQSAFFPDELASCEGVEVRERWVSTESGRIHVAFSSDLVLLKRCVEVVELPENRRLLFERVFELPSADPADEFRQELVGWQTVFLHEVPAVSSEDLWGFTEAEDGSLQVEFQDPKLFEALTARNIEKRIAFVLMDEVVSTPRIIEKITGGPMVFNPYPTKEGLGPLLDRLRAEQK